MATTIEDLQAVLGLSRPPKKKVDFAEYLAWPGTERVEWVDGEIVVMAAASIRHQLLAGFLFTVLNFYVHRQRSGLVLSAPTAMKLAVERRGREPDILFVRRERQYLLRENYLDGPADVAVEIVSPESLERDRDDKFAEYEASGVQEYWYLNPQEQEARFYQLGDDARYHLMPVTGDGIFRSEVVTGFWLRVDWLWQLPEPFAALHALGVV